MDNLRSLKKEEKNELEDLFSCKSFEEELQNIVDRGFAIEEEVAKDSLLFISMNPSFTEDSWNNGTEKGINSTYKIPSYNAPNTNDFFQAINKFYGGLGDNTPPLAHHDLLFIRETAQKVVLKWKDKLEKNNHDFFSKQLDLSKKIIEDSMPRLIVVLNAGSRVLFKKLFENEQCNPFFNKDIGAYIYQIGKKNTPVLFSGMLSGQRALDLGSRESLCWHIRFILNNIKSLCN